MGNLRLYGSSSGYVEIAPPAVGGSQVLTLPTDSVQPGMVLINKTAFSDAASVSVNNCFTSTYDAYAITFSLTAATTQGQMRFRWRASGADAASGNYFGGFSFVGNNTAGDSIQGSTTYMYMSDANPSYPHITGGYINIPRSPAIASAPILNYQSTGHSGIQTITYAGGWVYNVGGPYDGFSIIKEAGTFTGTVRVYGLRNS